MAEVVLRPIAALAQELAEGKTTSRKLVEAALARIADAGGEGGRVFTKVHAQGALLAADASDRLRKEGVVPSPLAGLPVSIKDLFDIAGDVTTAGSKILRDAAPATEDAVAVARLRTGGSVRIPAALCGIAGFKPTRARVPLGGAFPLSTTLDSVGPLAPTVACCATVFQVLAGEPPRPLGPAALPGLRLGVPKNTMLEDLDIEVMEAFDSAIQRLSRRGGKIVELE